MSYALAHLLDLTSFIVGVIVTLAGIGLLQVIIGIFRRKP